MYENIIEFEGIEGLIWNALEGKFTGDLSASGEFTGMFSYWDNESSKISGIAAKTRQVHLLVNPDPKDLWRSIDPPKDADFYKDNTYSDVLNLQNRKVVASSIRGKSHAQKGTFRDDHVLVKSWPETGWVLQVISDGAGSAEFSR